MFHFIHWRPSNLVVLETSSRANTILGRCREVLQVILWAHPLALYPSHLYLCPPLHTTNIKDQPDLPPQIPQHSQSYLPTDKLTSRPHSFNRQTIPPWFLPRWHHAHPFYKPFQATLPGQSYIEKPSVVIPMTCTEMGNVCCQAERLLREGLRLTVVPNATQVCTSCTMVFLS